MNTITQETLMCFCVHYLYGTSCVAVFVLPVPIHLIPTLLMFINSDEIPAFSPPG